ncbi:hypothetical protein N9544_06080 [Flavobacteriales bacterium]|nr:hypothetical protein [Flavobacteriales bacterium]
MNKRITEFLKKKGISIDLVNKLTDSSTTLHLRELNLQGNDMIVISEILNEEENNLKSISFSYNKIGDLGAIALAKNLPLSLHEIGLVGCGIEDTGGREILTSIKALPNIQMICMEQNNFSTALQLEFNEYEKKNPQILVII